MEQPGREDRLNAWIATERAARARLGASGTLELAQVAALSPQEFFDRIQSIGYNMDADDKMPIAPADIPVQPPGREDRVVWKYGIDDETLPESKEPEA